MGSLSTTVLGLVTDNKLRQVVCLICQPMGLHCKLQISCLNMRRKPFDNLTLEISTISAQLNARRKSQRFLACRGIAIAQIAASTVLGDTLSLRGYFTRSTVSTGRMTDFRLDGSSRQSPIASVQRTRLTRAGHSAVLRGTNTTPMNANRAIRIAAQRTARPMRTKSCVLGGETREI